jgi:hypothetical protein
LALVIFKELNTLIYFRFFFGFYLVLERNITRYSVENFLVIFRYLALQTLLCEEVLDKLKHFDDLIISA